jgi:dTDP-4-amino-4,6-dideoxygalactose transaminase|tara:strand:+ start:897 stop:2033 length:1137 start_codon:yes stop_codon:yes gene_type:complete
MQFVDLKSQYKIIKSDVLKSIENVLEHGQYIMGPEVIELEEKLAHFVGVKHCISCSSGTDGLLMSLMAMGVGPGDAVFTTPFTFVATAEVINLVGATPVFVDIDRQTYNIDSKQLELEVRRVSKEGSIIPKAIIPVDLFGLPADYDLIKTIANKFNLFIIEDAAQGFGGSINGKKACSFGDLSATSFFPAKPLGGYGDGGAIFTNDDSLSERLQSLRIHGKGENKYDNIRIGLNGRLDTIQAAILLNKFKLFPNELLKREAISLKYSERLKDLFSTPFIPSGYSSAWAQYSILADSSEHRTECQQRLKDRGVPSAIYYPIPLHLQTAYNYLNYKRGDFPVCEQISNTIFSLPMHPYLTDIEINQITSTLNNIKDDFND